MRVTTGQFMEQLWCAPSYRLLHRYQCIQCATNEAARKLAKHKMNSFLSLSTQLRFTTPPSILHLKTPAQRLDRIFSHFVRFQEE